MGLIVCAIGLARAKKMKIGMAPKCGQVEVLSCRLTGIPNTLETRDHRFGTGGTAVRRFVPVLSLVATLAALYFFVTWVTGEDLDNRIDISVFYVALSTAIVFGFHLASDSIHDEYSGRLIDALALLTAIIGLIASQAPNQSAELAKQESQLRQTIADNIASVQGTFDMLFNDNCEGWAARQSKLASSLRRRHRSPLTPEETASLVSLLNPLDHSCYLLRLHRSKVDQASENIDEVLQIGAIVIPEEEAEFLFFFPVDQKVTEEELRKITSTRRSVEMTSMLSSSYAARILLMALSLGLGRALFQIIYSRKVRQLR